MKIAEAAALIEDGLQSKIPNATWADLGCGSGTFTKALSLLLGDGSKIYAVDKESYRIQSPEASTTEIEFVKMDFMSDELPFSNLDGILMANSLHYVKAKTQFIEHVKKLLKPDGKMIIVEYDTEKQNPWIPYPIRFERLIEAFSFCGFRHIKKIGERNSVYRSEKMYASVIQL
jgi:ubiquinone/menaquinone biosynthesis C-methylase UbiE